MSAFTMQNGRAKRKQLAEELDRLDKVIDCLAENLNAAVADAVRDGARAAVREVLTDVLNHPAAAALLRPALPEPPAAASDRPGPWAKIKATGTAVVSVARRLTSAALGKARAAVARAVTFVKTRATAVRAKVRAARRVIGAGLQLERVLVVALGVGAAAAGVAMIDHTVASVLSGVGAAITTVAVQIGLWWRKVVRGWAAV